MILLQIGKSGPQGKEIKRSTFGGMRLIVTIAWHRG